MCRVLATTIVQRAAEEWPRLTDSSDHDFERFAQLHQAPDPYLEVRGHGADTFYSGWVD